MHFYYTKTLSFNYKNKNKNSSIDQYCSIELSVWLKCFKPKLSSMDLLV